MNFHVAFRGSVRAWEATFWSRLEERGGGGGGGEDAHGSRRGGVYCDWFRGWRKCVLVPVTRTIVARVGASSCFKAVVTRRVAVAASAASDVARGIPVEIITFFGATLLTNVAFDTMTAEHVVARTRAF